MTYTIHLASNTTKVLGYTGPDYSPANTFDEPEHLSRVCYYSTYDYALQSLAILYSGIPVDMFEIRGHGVG